RRAECVALGRAADVLDDGRSSALAPMVFCGVDLDGPHEMHGMSRLSVVIRGRRLLGAGAGILGNAPFVAVDVIQRGDGRGLGLTFAPTSTSSATTATAASTTGLAAGLFIVMIAGCFGCALPVGTILCCER